MCISSVSLASVPGLSSGAIKKLAKMELFTKAALARRDDLDDKVRDQLLTESITEAYASEPRRAVIGKIIARCAGANQVSKEDIDQLEALASNRNLTDDHMTLLINELNHKDKWRVHRFLASRKDVSVQGVQGLLQTLDLDVYQNLASNSTATLGPQVIQHLTTIAIADEEQRRAWLPSLRLAHRADTTDQGRLGMLHSYQR